MARIVNKKVKKKDKKRRRLFSCPIITTDLLSQLIFYRAAGKTSSSLNRFGLSYLFCLFYFYFLKQFFVLSLNLKSLVKFLSAFSHFCCCLFCFCTTFCHWLINKCIMTNTITINGSNLNCTYHQPTLIS